MGLNGLKTTIPDVKQTFPSVITCGQQLGVNSLPLQNGTNGDLYHRHGYLSSVGLDLAAPSSIDSPVVSPISVPVMNDIPQENGVQVYKIVLHNLH